MAGERVEGKTNNVDQHDQRAQPNAEVSAPIERKNHVVPEKSQEDDRKIEEVAVQVLDDQRKRAFAFVALVSAIADRA